MATKIGKDIEVIQKTPLIEELLARYQDVIGDDFAGYRGHIYRVLSYVMHILEGDPTYRKEIETALVYHDIGLWTDKELAYLEPSSVRALEDNRKYGWGFDEGLLEAMIQWHHKFLVYKGPHQSVVNAFRRGDWIDATMGFRTMGMPRACIKKVQNAIPAAGFYKTLMRLGPELTKGKTFKMLGKFSKVYKF